MWRSVLLFLVISLHVGARPTFRSHPTAWEEPWGKDSSLAIEEKPPTNQQKKGPAIWTSERLIRFHQTIISPVNGPRSKYAPSSSEYTRRAICQYGFFTGFLMGCDRLMRENRETWVYPIVAFADGNERKEDMP